MCSVVKKHEAKLVATVWLLASLRNLLLGLVF
jgi:hypothetical protein